jgi:hypothetical protein
MTTPAYVLTFQEAKNNLTDALNVMDKAAEAFVEEYGTDLKSLMSLILTHKSQWGGGTRQVNNVLEEMIRLAAQNKMELMIKKLK